MDQPSTDRNSARQPDPPIRDESRASIEEDTERQVRGLKFAVASVAIALGVVLTALSVQSGRITDKEGHGWPLSLLFGPVTGGINRQGWRVVTDPDQFLEDADRSYNALLVAFTFVDFGFIAMYGYLLWTVIASLTADRWQTAARFTLWGLVGVDVFENLLSLPGPSGIAPLAIVIATAVKWGLVAVIAGLVLLSNVTRRHSRTGERIGTRLKRGYLAVVYQRFAFVPMVALFVLSVLSGTAILEQLPDVLRRWISDGGSGVRHAVVSMAATLAVGTALIIAGRYRAGHAYRQPEPALPQPPTLDDPGRRPRLWIWVVGPGVALLGLLLTLASGQGRDVIWGRFAIYTLVPLVVIVVLSRVLRRWWRRHPDWYRYSYRPRPIDDRELTAVRLAGNLAGIGAIVVGGLSLIRAFFPLLTVPQRETGSNLAAVGFFLGVGAATVIAPWVVAIFVVRRSAARRLQRQEAGLPVELPSERKRDSPWRSTLLLGLGLGVFLLLGLVPGFAAWIGVAATANLALGSMAVMLSAVALIIQDRPTAEVFRAVGLQRSPIVSMLVLTLVLVSAFGGRNSIHAVDSGSDKAAVVTRSDMATTFGDWLSPSNPACLVQVGDRWVRPVLLIAAEGGGVRAAYWTVLGLDTIADETCGERSTLFSTGASGGSVGLTVARFSGTPTEPASQAAVEAVEQMAAPSTLARATDGTFVRDLLYGASGVPLQRIGEPSWSQWRDRARLIEDGWSATQGVDGQDWGDRDFLSAQEQLAPGTGALVLNSTDVKHVCRVWVSQIDLGPPVAETDEPSYDPERSCDNSPGPAARTVDLFSAYGPVGSGGDRSGCLGRIRASTAALLTARFPYVTPSGVVGPCPKEETDDGKALPHWPRTQLVDGGYIENSGLATVTDLSDDWLSEIRQHNAGVLATATPGADPTKPLVVPIVVFLTNGDRGVLQPAIDSSPTSELVVPPATFLRGGSSLSGNNALLERARAAVELDGFCPEEGPACAAVQQRFRSRVVVVDRVTQPEIGAPLGWVMSLASIESMKNAMEEARKARCVGNAPEQGGAYAPVQVDRESEPSCRTGYATLGDLISYYNARS